MALLVSSRAAAHGGGSDVVCFGNEPFAHDVRFPELVPGAIVVATNFGILVSRDSGATFRWICPAAYFVDTRPSFTTTSWANVVVLPDHSLFVHAGPGYRFSRDGGCTFEANP